MMIAFIREILLFIVKLIGRALMISSAFITINSGLVPLIEGLCVNGRNVGRCSKSEVCWTIYQCRSEVCWQIRPQEAVTALSTETVSLRAAIALYAELKDEFTWLWFTSEQMCFPSAWTSTQGGGGERKERAEVSDSSPSACGHLFAHHLAPVINNFISDEIKNALTTNLNRH